MQERASWLPLNQYLGAAPTSALWPAPHSPAMPLRAMRNLEATMVRRCQKESILHDTCDHKWWQRNNLRHSVARGRRAQVVCARTTRQPTEVPQAVFSSVLTRG